MKRRGIPQELLQLEGNHIETVQESNGTAEESTAAGQESNVAVQESNGTAPRNLL